MKAFLALLLCMSFLCLPVAVFAGPPSEADAKKVVKMTADAAIAFDKGDFEKALQLYNQAHALWANPKITFAIVKCLEALKRYKEALDAATRGLNENPDATIQSRLMGKKATLEQALTKGKLDLRIAPTGSTVLIDGKSVGNAPLDPIELSVGNHQIEISHPNHAKIVQGVTIVGGTTLKLSFTLQPLTGELSVTSQPEGAEVNIDGKDWGKTPLKSVKLTIGSHSIVISYPGYQSVRKQINISPQQAESISVLLSEQTKAGEVVSGPWYHSWPGWTLLGIGVAAGVVGAIFTVRSAQSHQTLRNAINAPESTALSQKDITTQWGQANNDEKLGYALIGVAGGGIVLAAILFATRAGAGTQPAPQKTAAILQKSPLDGGLQRQKATLSFSIAY